MRLAAVLSIDLDRELRAPRDLQILVRAVMAATENDESFFLEWKSGLDLSSKAGIFPIAKCILAMANRDPDVAATALGGLGYLVVGAKDGEVPGVEPVDLVELDSLLRPYLGDRLSRWSPQYVTIEDKQVLVVTIEAPRWGDPIWTLRKDAPPGNGNVLAGMIFHRNKANSAVASPEQVEMLQNRFARSSVQEPRLDVEVKVGLEELATVDWGQERFEEWLEVLKRSLLVRDAPPGTSFDEIVSGNVKFPERYLGDLADYLEKVTERAQEVAIERVIKGEVGQDNGIRFSLSNPGPITLSDVEMALKLPSKTFFGVHSENEGRWEDLPMPPAPPKRPDPFGLRVPELFSLNSGFDIPPVQPLNSSVTVDEWEVEGEVTVRIRFSDLRALDTLRGPTLYLFPMPSAVNSTIQAHYTLTTPTVHAVQQGSFEIKIGSDVVPFTQAMPVDLILLGGL